MKDESRRQKTKFDGSGDWLRVGSRCVAGRLRWARSWAARRRCYGNSFPSDQINTIRASGLGDPCVNASMTSINRAMPGFVLHDNGLAS